MKVRGGHPSKTWWAPYLNLQVDKSESRAPLQVDADSKKCQIVVFEMAKRLVHSFYYQPKGMPTSRDNFSGSGGVLTQASLKVFIHLKKNKNASPNTIYPIVPNSQQYTTQIAFPTRVQFIPFTSLMARPFPNEVITIIFSQSGSTLALSLPSPFLGLILGV